MEVEIRSKDATSVTGTNIKRSNIKLFYILLLNSTSTIIHVAYLLVTQCHIIETVFVDSVETSEKHPGAYWQYFSVREWESKWSTAITGAQFEAEG